MPFLLLILNFIGAFFGIITLMLFFFLVSAYLIIAVTDNKHDEASHLFLASAVLFALTFLIYRMAVRFVKKKSLVEGIIEKKEERTYDDGKSFYVYTFPGSIENEINETAFAQLKKGDKIKIKYFKGQENAVWIKKIKH